MGRGTASRAATARLADVQRSLEPLEVLPAAGALAWLRSRLSGGPAAVPEVSGAVRSCFRRPSDGERAAAGWQQATGRFERHSSSELALSSDPHSPDLHPFAALADGEEAEGPSERGLLAQTAEAYSKLREALPESAALLGPERPGSGEDLFIDGLDSHELCVGDVFTADGTGIVLQVSSPRRPCEVWNTVHATSGFLDGTELTGAPPQRRRLHGAPLETEGNVRHFALVNTLAGFFFRVLRGGVLTAGAKLTLASRPHPSWPLKRLGDLLYGGARVEREGWVAWSGTEKEREELLAMTELAEHEWKDVLRDPAMEMTRDY